MLLVLLKKEGLLPHLITGFETEN
uniref:Uncharacterized protein n=1 Tax=Anopheles atroparvus TaxID=41427 RepID=A0AAG5DUG1_ANOAO